MINYTLFMMCRIIAYNLFIFLILGVYKNYNINMELFSLIGIIFAFLSFYFEKNISNIKIYKILNIIAIIATFSLNFIIVKLFGYNSDNYVMVLLLTIGINVYNVIYFLDEKKGT